MWHLIIWYFLIFLLFLQVWWAKRWWQLHLLSFKVGQICLLPSSPVWRDLSLACRRTSEGLPSTFYCILSGFQFNFSSIPFKIIFSKLLLDIHNRQRGQINPEYSRRHVEKWWLSLPSNGATQYMVCCGTNGTNSVRSLWSCRHSR